MTTVVFPDAGVRVYLDADESIRAARRAAERGDADVVRSEKEQRERDRQASTRSHSPLMRAADAAYLDSTHLTVDEVVEWILRRVRDAGQG